MEEITRHCPVQVPEMGYVKELLQARNRSSASYIDDCLGVVAAKIEGVVMLAIEQKEKSLLKEYRKSAGDNTIKKHEGNCQVIKFLTTTTGGFGGAVVGFQVGRQVKVQVGPKVATGIHLAIVATGVVCGAFIGTKVAEGYELILRKGAEDGVVLCDADKKAIRNNHLKISNIRKDCVFEILSTVKKQLATVFDGMDSPFVHKGEWINDPCEIGALNDSNTAIAIRAYSHIVLNDKEEFVRYVDQSHNEFDRKPTREAVGVKVMGLYAQGLKIKTLLEHVEGCSSLGSFWNGTEGLKKRLQELLYHSLCEIELGMSEVKPRASKAIKDAISAAKSDTIEINSIEKTRQIIYAAKEELDSWKATWHRKLNIKSGD